MISSHLARALADARVAAIHDDVRINRQLPVRTHGEGGGADQPVSPSLPRPSWRPTP